MNNTFPIDAFKMAFVFVWDPPTTLEMKSDAVLETNDESDNKCNSFMICAQRMAISVFPVPGLPIKSLFSIIGTVDNPCDSCSQLYSAESTNSCKISFTLSIPINFGGFPSSENFGTPSQSII